ncbi:MAG: hypothetical protein JWM40_1030 [Frankiales bacterium]|nr:hypothetical protein [Frankiales bacterium]
MTLAAEEYAARLQVGRLLTGSALSAVVAVRNLATGLVSGGLADIDAVAPAWVVVSRRADGKEVGRLTAGREAGAGEGLLASVTESMQQLSPQEFLLQWHLGDG